jgi:nucleotide-binding universal stress UspA family protein
MRFRTILCPTDLSATGNGAAAVAFALAEHGATVHLLYAWEPPFVGSLAFGPYPPPHIAPPDQRRAKEEEVRATLASLVPKDAVARGLRVEPVLEEGPSVAAAIAAVARRVKADAVVMGTHGRTGLGRVVLGSVAEEVMKKKDVPVVLVHSPE